MKKDIILDIIKNEDTPLTAQDIFKKVSKNIDINLSTVYRALNNLEKSGMIVKTIHHDKIAYYELSSADSKSYLICDRCNNSYVTSSSDIEKLSKKIKKETGFNITSHTLELHGICSKCMKNAK